MKVVMDLGALELIKPMLFKQNTIQIICLLEKWHVYYATS